MFQTMVYTLCFPGAAQCGTREVVDYTSAIYPVGILLIAAVVGLIIGLTRNRRRER
ncbi:hypothetical protein [Microbacterium candidum]|uniref:LPXTG cell wall anchor domain-containing protein n=1 Tax=Microbacterium candidum TaxID=3041922 RepID=A0ABT7MYJ2_9MICO|nr:hypothetical protein [Microbacterium sp. ASV49]MDL9979525.1 hypothetical protein [Microbacterium sp. ASV49]